MVTIPDAPAPLAQFPQATTPDSGQLPAVIAPEEEYVIVDEEVPMGNLPQTGTGAMSGAGLFGIGISGLLGLLGAERKKKETKQH